MLAKISLEQWRAFVATVEHDGFLPAAEYLNKTQSAVSHAIKKMEDLLGQELFIIEGRKAVLTDLGRALLPEAKHLLSTARKVERLADLYRPGLRSELSLSVDILFPSEILYAAFAQFSDAYPHHRIRLYESALSGTQELMAEGMVELGIANLLPPQCVSQFLLSASLLCVCHAQHPLATGPQPVTLETLAEHRQIVVRDSGRRQETNHGWLGSTQRWTVTSFDTMLALVLKQHGFAWLPSHKVKDLLAAGTLVEVPLAQNSARVANLQLGYSEALSKRPEVVDMANIIQALCQDYSA
ncbi:MAG: LysR family transcriptional regulator [Neisseriaceae bacterium]|nr:LysR family transcriptional regulator [Neisseriaceae bacterium]MBP6862817.1 LysR family transcriptional regulator [Neisseriaceae bacterium]